MVKNLPAALLSVKAALMRRGRTPHDADDFVQEAWLRLARYELSQVVLQPEAFLMRTALNLSIDAYRVSANRGEHVLVDDIQLADERPSIERTLLAREQIEMVSDFLAGLEERTRSIFLAHRVDGLSYIEIANEHGLSVSSVEKHVAKAMLLMARSMAGYRS